MMHRAEVQVQKPWGLMPQGVGCPSRVPGAKEPSTVQDCTLGDFLFFGDSERFSSALKGTCTNALGGEYFILCSH